MWSEPNDDPYKRTIKTVEQTKEAIEYYYSQFNKLPDGLGLNDLVTKEIARDLPMDSWGNEIQFIKLEAPKTFLVISYGADGIEGGKGLNKDIQIIGEVGI